MPSIRPVAFSNQSRAGCQLCGPPHRRPAKNPGAAPVPARSPHSLKDTVPVETPGNSVVARRNGFEVVPGKDPNGWSFILEPYLWALGVDGTVGVKGFDTHVDYNPLTVVKHLDWGIMAKGEVRKGKWGILGDGFFAQLSASGDTPGPLYNNANIKLQQGMVELALAYRIIDDRRGFLDIYAGARYNYFGINIGASIDDAGVQDVGNSLAGNIASRVRQRADAIIGRRAQNAALSSKAISKTKSPRESRAGSWRTGPKYAATASTRFPQRQGAFERLPTCATRNSGISPRLLPQPTSQPRRIN